MCKIFGADNVFLQQAAHLTGGAYVRVEKTDALLQYMMVGDALGTCVVSPTATRPIPRCRSYHLQLFDSSYRYPRKIA